MKASASRWAMPAVGSSSSSRRGSGQDDRRQVDHPAGAGGEVGGEVVAEPLEPERADHLVDGPTLGPLGAAGPRQLQGGGQDADRPAGVLAEQERVLHRELGEEPAVLERPHHAERSRSSGR